MESSHFHDALIFLAAAVCVVTLFRLLRISAVLGYLAAGVLVGPQLSGLIEDDANIHFLAELGVVFLLFAIGLELSFERLRIMRRLVFGLGFLQVAVTSLAIGLALWSLGFAPEAAILLGGGLALSSTAFVVQLLSDRGQLATRQGRAAIAVLLFQDLAVIPLLALVPLLGREGASLGAALGLAGLKALAAVAATLLAGRLLLRPLYRLVAASGSNELFVAVTLLVVLGSGWLMTLAGLSMSLGAFLTGLILAETEYRHEVEADIRPFRGLLLGLFFMSVGLALDLELVALRWPELLLGLFLLIVSKALIVTLLGRLLGLSWATAAQVAALLAQGGEFAFVLVGAGSAMGLIPLEAGQLAIAIVALSMMLTPGMASLGERLGRFLRRDRGKSASPFEKEDEGPANHIVIAGFGRVGQTVAQVVASAGYAYVGIDSDAELVGACRRRGLPVFFGDAARLEILDAAGLRDARAVVVTLDRSSVAARTLKAVRERRPEVPLYLRGRDLRAAANLEREGATAVVPEALEASLQLGGLLLEAIGASEAEVARAIQGLRENRYERLEETIFGSSEEPR